MFLRVRERVYINRDTGKRGFEEGRKGEEESDLHFVFVVVWLERKVEGFFFFFFCCCFFLLFFLRKWGEVGLS